MTTPGLLTAFLKTTTSGVMHLLLARSSPTPVAPLSVDWRHRRLYFRPQKQEQLYAYTVIEYETLTGLHYAPILSAQNAAIARLVGRRCQRLWRQKQLTTAVLWRGSYYGPALARAEVAPVYIAWTGLEREWGLYARQPLPNGTFIGEYTGQLSLLSFFAKVINPYCFHYPLPLAQWLWFTIDAESYGNETRFLNHNDVDPNCAAYVAYYNGFLRVVICAIRSIAVDEELTYDYGPTVGGQRRTFKENTQ